MTDGWWYWVWSEITLTRQIIYTNVVNNANAVLCYVKGHFEPGHLKLSSKVIGDKKVQMAVVSSWHTNVNFITAFTAQKNNYIQPEARFLLHSIWIRKWNLSTIQAHLFDESNNWSINRNVVHWLGRLSYLTIICVSVYVCDSTNYIDNYFEWWWWSGTIM